jgi:hypothetical protein
VTRLILAGLIGWLTPGISAHHDPQPCATIQACRSDLAHARHALAWQRRARHALERRLRVRWQPTALYAIGLASRVYGVSETAMRSVAACESGLDPTVTNGQYAGLFQMSPAFITSTPLRGFSRFDPLANALAAASVVRVQGWRQWTCQP